MRDAESDCSKISYKRATQYGEGAGKSQALFKIAVGGFPP